MSDDDNSFQWGGGDGADAAESSDEDSGANPAAGLAGSGSDEENAFQWQGGGSDGGGSDDGGSDDGNSFNWGGGGGGSDDDSDENDSDGDDGDRPGEPASSLDLLGSLLSTADMTGAMREPEPEPEPQAQATKKRNKHKRTADPKAMMRAMKEAQNAQDAGSPKASGQDVGGGAANFGGAALRTGAAQFKTVVVDSASSRWSIGLEGELEPRSFSDAGVDLETCWDDLEDFMEDYCDGVVSSGDYAVLFSVPALESNTQTAQELADVALGERFGFARCSVVAREVLTMYAQAVSTGLVINLGETSVTCVPIYEGALLYEGMRRMESSSDVAPAALVDMALSSVMSSPVDTRNDLFGSVMVVGDRSLDWSDDQQRRFESSLRRRFRQRYGGVIRGGRAKACADFTAQQVGDLNLEKGDEVTLMQRQGQWCQGENGAGETGLFPLAFVDLVPAQVEPDFPCILKKQYRDKYGSTRFRDEATEFSFGVELPPKEERQISAWIGGSVLAATEGWEGLWCSTAAELEKCPTLHRDERFQKEQLLESQTAGIVITLAPDDNATSLDPELVVDSWMDWMEDWESELLSRRQFWYFTNQPVSTESAGSRFEDLSKLEAIDRFGETMPEAARSDFYYGQRNAREKEMLDAKAWAKLCMDNARDTIANSDCDKWHAVCSAQSKYSEPRTLEMRATVSGDALEPPQKPLNLKWYAWGEGEPTEEDLKDHIYAVWQLNRPGAVMAELHLLDADAHTAIPSTRAVGDFLELSADKPVSAAEIAAEAAVAAENNSESDSDDDEISYDELPPNVQGMSILEQLEWKKQEIARRKAARLAKAGGKQSGHAPASPPAARAGDASSAMLDDLLGGGGSGGGSDTMSSDDDDEGARGLSSALFDTLMVTAQGDDQKMTGEMDFDSMENLGIDARASRKETTGLSLEDLMEAEQEEGESIHSSGGDRSVREKDMFDDGGDDELASGDRSVRETDFFGGDDGDGDDGDAAGLRKSRAGETTGMSMEDLMDAQDEGEGEGEGIRQSRHETSGLSLEDLMDAEEEQAAAAAATAQSHSRDRRSETSGMSMEDIMEAAEADRGDKSVREKDMFDDAGDDDGDDGDGASGDVNGAAWQQRAVVGVGGEADTARLLHGGSDSDSGNHQLADSAMISAEYVGESGEDDDDESDGEEVPDDLPPPPPPATTSSRREMDFESMMGAVDSAKLPSSDEDDDDAVQVDEFGLPVIETESNPLASTADAADNVLDGLDDLASMVAAEDTSTSQTLNPLADAADPVAAAAAAAAAGGSSKAEQLLLKARARREPQPAQTAYVNADGDELENFDL